MSFLDFILANTDNNQFADDFFDAILDKGGLDALMEPEYGSKLGIKYLKEVTCANICSTICHMLLSYALHLHTALLTTWAAWSLGEESA